MFNPKLIQHSATRLTVATPFAFRILFFAIGLFLAVAAGLTAQAPFYQWPPLLLAMIVVCVASAAYLERWTFDMATGFMERHLGVIFWHSRAKTPLADLTRITLSHRGVPHERRPRLMRALTRPTAVLAVIDRSGTAFPLDIVKGAVIQEAQVLGARLAEFCDVDFDDHVAPTATEGDDQQADVEQGEPPST